MILTDEYYSTTAEQEVLGGLLFNNSSFETVIKIINDDDFYYNNHQLIFSGIKKIISSNGIADAVTVFDLLEDEAVDFGGIAYLIELVKDTFTVGNIKAHAEIIKKKSELRKNTDNFSPLPVAQEWVNDLSSNIDYVIPFPGVAREIQQYIMRTSHKIQPGIAYAATLSILSTVIGRNFICQGIKGNVLSLCLAESGEGKDWPFKAVARILSSIEMDDRIYGQMASGAALRESLQEQNEHSIVLLIDEIGHYFAGMSGKNSSQYSKEVMPMITEMYTSAADAYRPKKTLKGNRDPIVEPNLSLLGFSTERQLMDTVRSSDVSDGSLARFFVLFGENNVPINRNRDKSTKVPTSIIKGLNGLMAISQRDKIMPAPIELEISDEYNAVKIELEEKYQRMGVEAGKQGGDKAIFKPFYYRLAVKAMQQALLIDQCGDIDVLNWCANVVQGSNSVFVMKYLHLCADNETERMVKIIERAIKESGTNGICSQQLKNKSRAVPPTLKRQILNELIDCGQVFVSERRIGGSKRATLFYFWRK
jgi:hypothetical protein